MLRIIFQVKNKGLWVWFDAEGECYGFEYKGGLKENETYKSIAEKIEKWLKEKLNEQ
jgi:hypothetical protein